jgi:hypothetical protein
VRVLCSPKIFWSDVDELDDSFVQNKKFLS